jgi:site-specific recombinase XerD
LKTDSYPTVKRWLSKIVSRRTRSENTVKIYLWHLNKYCEWAGKTPDQLIEEHLKNQNSESESVKRKHEEMLTQYFAYLEDTKKLARNTALVAHAVVRSFYKANYASLKVDTPESWSIRQDRVPKKAEIALMIEKAQSPLEEALIAFSAQSGQRVGIITALRYGMVKEALDSTGPGRVHVPADLRDSKGKLVNKRRQTYDFFIGEDAKRLLINYLKRRGELRDDDLVFVSSKRVNGRETALDDEAVNRLIRRAARNAGVFGAGVTKQMHHHVLRKFFQTAMEEAGVAWTWYEQMMGHVLPKTQKAYSKPSVEQLKQAYAKAERYLSIVEDKINVQKEPDVRVLVWAENLRIMGLDPVKLRSEFVNKFGREPSVEEEIKLYMEQIEKMRSKQGGSEQTSKSERKSERRVVDQDQIENLIEEGWEPIMQLANGRVVVRRENV